MKSQTHAVPSRQSGFSLIELLVVIGLLSIIAALAYRTLYSSRNEIGGAERVLEQTAARLVERRAEATRLNNEDRRVDSEKYIPPLPMDFKNLATTASLITEGDSDGDCLDDVTGKRVTCIRVGLGASWQLAQRDDALILPDQWKVARFASDLGEIPLIGEGSEGRGVLATNIGFDGDGRAYAYQSRGMFGTWKSVPNEYTTATSAPSLNSAQFWSIYFVGTDKDSGAVIAAVAVAVHPTGYIEKFRYDGEKWIGFQNRNL